MNSFCKHTARSSEAKEIKPAKSVSRSLVPHDALCMHTMDATQDVVALDKSSQTADILLPAGQEHVSATIRRAQKV